MSSIPASAPEVYSAREIACAAGVSPREVRRLIASGDLKTLDGRMAAAGEAVRQVRLLRGLRTRQPRRDLFGPPETASHSPGSALAVSGTFHAALLAGLVLLTTMGLSSAPAGPSTSMRLVFLPLPGPGGGGGGGGLKQPAPPAPAALKGNAALRSPVPPPRPLTSRPPRPEPVRPVPRPEPAPRPVEPPPVAVPVAPQVVAPVATVAADPQDRAGVLADAARPTTSSGPGTGTGAGTGQGTGIGEGNGAGVGPGEGGGTGGGPYRPGSGITPPSVLREVKPDYTEEGRRRGLQGDVVLEIVVRRDGTVGEVKLLQGLGAGLDQRAADAVRAWRFSPAKRFGIPVDVLVEVAVEFKLR